MESHDAFDDAERVQRPPGADPAWCLQALTKLRREEMGDIAIRLELTGRNEVYGHLDRVSSVLGTRGTIMLAEGERISCDDVEAFTVLLDEPYDFGR
ncbi:MAG: hypothetical protein ACREX8_22455 [Gammaproteobacteria bacterium]